MSEKPTEPSDRITAGQIGAGVASLAEAWLRDSAFGLVGLLSVIVAIVGFADAGGGAAGLAAVAGVVAFALPAVAVVRRSPVRWIWLAIVVGAALDALALALLLSR